GAGYFVSGLFVSCPFFFIASSDFLLLCSVNRTILPDNRSAKKQFIMMQENSLYKILFDGASSELLVEIVLRTLIMFLLILIILRISGRRGVRQLTLFEVAIILGLGSAAGDPMFQDDLPILHAILVFLTVI